VIHVVKDQGDLSVSFLDVLEKTGLGYQYHHGDMLRWCETVDGSDPVTCVDAPRHTYQDDDEGRRTLVVFTTDGAITLRTHVATGRKWGPSVLAPLATITLDSHFADGTLIAKQLNSLPNNGDAQMHGECFNQQILCWGEPPTPEPPTPPPPPPATCHDFMPHCYTAITQEDCTFGVHTIGTDVHCGGDLHYDGDVSAAFDGQAWAANGEGWQNDLARFHKGTADVSKSTLDVEKYVELLEQFKDTDAYFRNYLGPQGWVKFGQTGQSFYKDDCETTDAHGETRTERCVIHVVKDQGDLSVSFLDVLEKTGLGYQYHHGDMLRWCETVHGSHPVTCVDAPRHTYQDDDEGRRTLVVFVTDGAITLRTHAATGRKWGPSVLAPLATITLDSDFADGTLIAKKLNSLPNNGNSHAQMHGECFNQHILCVP